MLPFSKQKMQCMVFIMKKTSMMDIFSLIHRQRNKEILIIEPTKYAPANPSSWKELYKYIQLAAFQNGISLGVNKGGKSLGYYNVQCKRGRMAQCSVREKISEAKGSDNVSDYA